MQAGFRLTVLLTGLLITCATTAAYGLDLPEPTGPVLLTITGNIGTTNGAKEARFDREMLMAIGGTELTTHTMWTEGQAVFSGVMGRELLELADAKGDEITARALNDYAVTIPTTDFIEYPVLLALTMNGEPMRVRDRGPIWIVYPVASYPELDTPLLWRRWIWQLNRLHVGSSNAFLE